MTLTFTATSYLNRDSYFYSYKALKNKYGSYSNSYNYFLYCKLFVRYIKNQIGTMIHFHRLSFTLVELKLKNLKLIIFPDSWHTKKSSSIRHTCNNIQSNANDIKLSSCTFRLCRNKISALTKVIQPRKFFRILLWPILQTSSVFRPLITTGN